MTRPISCPACGRDLRLPDDLVGQRVECPECDHTFTATPSPREDDDHDHGEPPPATAADPGGYGRARTRPAPVRGRVETPAACLVFTGIMAMLLGGGLLALGLVAKAAQQNGPPQPPPPAAAGPAQPPPPEIDDEGVVGLLVLGILHALWGGVVAAGGFAMLRLGSFPVAMTGAIVAMVPCGFCCSPLGVPFGLWSVIVLADPDVRGAFT